MDIRAIKDHKKAAFDVARYTSRPCCLANFEVKDQAEIFTAFHGKRLCGSFGTGRQILLKAKNFEDRTNWQRLPSWEVVVANQYDGGAFHAVLSAWLNNTPVAYDTVAALIRPDPNEKTAEYLCLHVTEEKQLVLEGFS